jgi:hypothetical protein
MNINWNDWNIEEYEEIYLTNKKLVKFLKNNNAYDSFIYNLKKKYEEYEEKKINKSLETFCDDIDKSQYINSLYWDFSKEGFNYWSQLDYKWKNSLKIKDSYMDPW